MVKKTSQFSGQSVELPAFAACVYEYTIYKNHVAEEMGAATGQPHGISEHQDEWKNVRNGLDFFRRYFAKEYMVLLD